MNSTEQQRGIRGLLIWEISVFYQSAIPVSDSSGGSTVHQSALPYTGAEIQYYWCIGFDCRVSVDVHWCKSLRASCFINRPSSSSSSSFICSNQLQATRRCTHDQHENKSRTRKAQKTGAYILPIKTKKNKHSRCKNNYDYAYRKNLEKSTRLSDRLNLDNVYSKSFIARAMDPHSSLRFSRGHLQPHRNSGTAWSRLVNE